jgi:hypothetical protein
VKISDGISFVCCQISYVLVSESARDRALVNRQDFWLIERRTLYGRLPGASRVGDPGRDPAEYLHRQKLNLAVHREVVCRCKAQGSPALARHTVASRIARLLGAGRAS